MFLGMDSKGLLPSLDRNHVCFSVFIKTNWRAFFSRSRTESFLNYFEPIRDKSTQVVVAPPSDVVGLSVCKGKIGWWDILWKPNFYSLT